MQKFKEITYNVSHSFLLCTCILLIIKLPLTFKIWTYFFLFMIQYFSVLIEKEETKHPEFKSTPFLSSVHLQSLNYIFWQYWNLNSGTHTC
jgi:hypothetical protein